MDKHYSSTPISKPFLAKSKTFPFRFPINTAVGTVLKTIDSEKKGTIWNLENEVNLRTLSSKLHAVNYIIIQT